MASCGGLVTFLSLLTAAGARTFPMNSSFERAVTRFRNLSYRYDVPRRTRYAVAAGAAALAVFLTGSHATASVARVAPSVLFVVVVLSSWYGGLGPGLLSVFVVGAG